jgi:type VI secretion system protein ImpA
MTPEFIEYRDWAEWLEVISAQHPCGIDLEYDPAFRLLDEAVSGRPEVQYGTTVVPAVPPDWKTADALCLDLLSRSRDFRIVAHLSRARLARDGVVGLADGLALVHGLIERHWEQVHPQLDASDADDPTARINALAAFADNAGMVNDLLDIALLPPLHPQAMTVTLREWSFATGEVAAPEGRAVMSLAEIDAALAAHQDKATLLKAAFGKAAHHAERIEAALTERVGAGRALNLSALKTPLRRAHALFDDCLAKLGGQSASSFDAPAGNPASNPASDPAGDPATAQVMPQVEALAQANVRIVTRADVIAALDRLCDYYAVHEPSSPVPLLLGRARGLVDKSFVDLLKDLAPDGLAQLANVMGPAGTSASPD